MTDLCAVRLEEVDGVGAVGGGVPNVWYPVEDGWRFVLGMEEELTAGIEEDHHDQPNGAVDCERHQGAWLNRLQSNHGGRGVLMGGTATMLVCRFK